MGLDMYLNKKTYVGFNYDHNREEDGSVPLTIEGKHDHIKPKRVSEIIESIGYWRKANAIHAWFVTHVQEGVDDCGEYHVSEDQLKALLEVVTTVLATIDTAPGTVTIGHRAGPDTGGELVPVTEEGEVVINPEVVDALLPTQAGFFFGSTVYDQYYKADLESTRDIVTAALAEKDGDIYYQSSW